MKYFLYLLLSCSPIVYADDKISAPYDENCDNKIETFHKVIDLEISNRYKVTDTLKLNQSTNLYILERISIPNKNKSCQYIDFVAPYFLFIIQNENEKIIVNKKLLSNLKNIYDISLDKTANGFSISIAYAYSFPAESKSIFKTTTAKKIFLKKVIWTKVVPDGEDNEKNIQNFPESKKYELPNIVLSDFF